MKKTLAFLLICAFVLGLSACATESKTEDSQTEVTKIDATLNIVTPTQTPSQTPTQAPTQAPTAAATTAATAATEEVICLSISLDTDLVILDKAGNAQLISYKLLPENATSKITFTSRNPEIATVDEKGNVTAVAEGETQISIQCGKASKLCFVYCDFLPEGVESTDPTAPQEGTIRLNRKDISFTYKGEAWELYSGDVSKELIHFSSDNESVATFVNGRVVAVGNGTTTVYATYGEQKVGCVIRCSFQESSGTQGSGGVSEDGGGDAGAIPVNLTGKITNVQATLNVRSGPGTSYDKVGTLPLGELVTITEIQYASDGYQWAHIQTGWVRMDYIELT